MKRLFTILFFLSVILPFSAQSQEKIKVATPVKKVTVFLNGAQIFREGKAMVPAGESKVVFTGLSPFVNPKSIQVKGDGNFMITGIKFDLNYRKNPETEKELKALKKQYEKLKEETEKTSLLIKITQEEIDFLNKNKDIGGNEKISVNDLKTMEDYYRQKMRELQFKKWELEKKLEKLNEEQEKLEKEIEQKAGLQEFPTGEIVVETSAPARTQAKFQLSYNVKYARWYPQYEIRAKEGKNYINLIYKANVVQNTQVDWNKVNLSLSSGNPAVAMELPELKPLYIDTGGKSRTETSGYFTGEVHGKVLDAETGEPLPGVNIIVKGTSIGTVTDFDGTYSLKVPGSDAVLIFSYVGFEDEEVPVKNRNTINVYLQPGEALEEVVINVAGVKRNKKLFARGTKTVREKRNRVDEEAPKSISLPVELSAAQTTVNFEIKKPYTVKSGNIPVHLEITRYKIPVEYLYKAVPALTSDVYLTASFTGAEKYKLLPGEAQVFSNGIFVGKTLIRSMMAEDTLQISLGPDKAIAVSREAVKDYTKKKIIGNKVVETREWRIKIKNNKSKKIRLEVKDRVPVSKISAVTVETEELSGGKMDAETGIVTWNLNLGPGKSKELRLRYVLKYPKYLDVEVD